MDLKYAQASNSLSTLGPVAAVLTMYRLCTVSLFFIYKTTIVCVSPPSAPLYMYK